MTALKLIKYEFWFSSLFFFNIIYETSSKLDLSFVYQRGLSFIIRFKF